MKPVFSILLGVMLGHLPLHAEKKIVAYMPNWIDVAAFAKTIDYGKVTHLNMAFENPSDDTGGLSFEPGDAEVIRLAHAANAKVLVSLGGGSASTDGKMRALYSKLLSDTSRPAFVGKLVRYVDEHDFDGIDVDLEGPSIDKNYGAFISDLSAALKPAGKLLTAALSEGYGGDRVPDSVFGQLDFVNIMAYDATGPWERNHPGQHSSLEFAKEAVGYWTGRGLPKAKLMLGVPFYGYGFGRDFQDDGYPYADILVAHPEADHLDEVGKTIWLNSLPTIRAKARYVLDEDLGGIMIWSLEQDTKDDRSLLRAIYDILAAPR